jgi:hypothetical protein
MIEVASSRSLSKLAKILKFEGMSPGWYQVSYWIPTNDKVNSQTTINILLLENDAIEIESIDNVFISNRSQATHFSHSGKNSAATESQAHVAILKFARVFFQVLNSIGIYKYLENSMRKIFWKLIRAKNPTFVQLLSRVAHQRLLVERDSHES